MVVCVLPAPFHRRLAHHPISKRTHVRAPVSFVHGQVRRTARTRPMLVHHLGEPCPRRGDGGTSLLEPLPLRRNGPDFHKASLDVQSACSVRRKTPGQRPVHALGHPWLAVARKFTAFCPDGRPQIVDQTRVVVDFKGADPCVLAGPCCTSTSERTWRENSNAIPLPPFLGPLVTRTHAPPPSYPRPPSPRPLQCGPGRWQE